jgi:hypothetical protein
MSKASLTFELESSDFRILTASSSAHQTLWCLHWYSHIYCTKDSIFFIVCFLNTSSRGCKFLKCGLWQHIQVKIDKSPTRTSKQYNFFNHCTYLYKFLTVTESTTVQIRTRQITLDIKTKKIAYYQQAIRYRYSRCYNLLHPTSLAPYIMTC